MKEYNGDGYDCTCRAQCESECCCGADWTDSEIYELRAEIAKLKALMSVWVSVDERLPNEEGHYLLYHPSWHVEVGLFYQGQLGTIGLTYDDPTHWMPLPPAPTA